MNAPQAVTERYVTNLIHYGQNKEYAIDTIVRRSNIILNDHCGFYFTVQVVRFNIVLGANGATIQQAVHRALEKHGVTFR